MNEIPFVPEPKPTADNALWIDGKPVYGEFTRKQLAEAYGDVDELILKLREQHRGDLLGVRYESAGE